jgi:predicted amidohydrolase
MHTLSPALLLSILTAVPTPADAAGPRGRSDLPGRQVRVAAIAIGFGGNREAKLKLACDHLDTAGQRGSDIACLPEEFAGYETPEALDGPIVKAVAERAARHHMYVICPIREVAPDGHLYNTAVLIGRDGRTIGWYRKVFVFWNEGVNVSREGVRVFDLDFGRISILTCFDANFAELWHEADLKGAEVVFWPSAYGGGMPLAGYAMCHNYFVVPVGRGNILDTTGRPVVADNPRPDQFVATIDLDRTFVHRDFNREKIQRLLADHKDEVRQSGDYEMEGWFGLEAVKPGVRVRDLLRQYQVETLREYRHRSRERINQARKEDKRI